MYFPSTFLISSVHVDQARNLKVENGRKVKSIYINYSFRSCSSAVQLFSYLPQHLLSSTCFLGHTAHHAAISQVFGMHTTHKYCFISTNLCYLWHFYRLELIQCILVTHTNYIHVCVQQERQERGRKI